MSYVDELNAKFAACDNRTVGQIIASDCQLTKGCAATLDEFIGDALSAGQTVEEAKANARCFARKLVLSGYAR